MPSTIETNSSAQEDSDLLPPSNNPLPPLSEKFEISDTVYGGRGCFATEKIVKGEVILECNRPFGYTITREFKKEVCAWCFRYDNGRTMKSKLASKNGKHSINFCSQECLEGFKHYDQLGLLMKSLLSIEKLDVENYSEETPEILSKKDIDLKWMEVQLWETSLPKKPSKREKFLPSFIDEAVYDELKYLSTVLYELYLDSSKEIPYFNGLQSNEYEKVMRFPQLLLTYVNTYQVLKFLMPQEFQPFITIPFVRSTLGKENSNAFGIWSPQINDEYQEYLGFGLFPSASLFNHSCSPNLQKVRDGAKIYFKVIKDIKPGDEMYISYGSVIETEFEARQIHLREWFFDCACKRCKSDELKLIASQ